MAKIGLFGGSFNPVHVGHLIVARSLAERLGLEKVFLIPAAAPPHKPAGALAPASDRLEMVRLAVRGEPLFEPSDCELRRPGPSYTIHTVEEFQRILPRGTEIYWIIGADTLPDLVNWYEAERLVDLCTIVTAWRPGWERIDFDLLGKRFTPAQIEKLKKGVVHTPCIEISSTDIRRRLAEGRSIRYLVPEAVAEYIYRRGLYGATRSSTDC